eukprot:6422987-Amphidinium_carterae.1
MGTRRCTGYAPWTLKTCLKEWVQSVPNSPLSSTFVALVVKGLVYRTIEVSRHFSLVACVRTLLDCRTFTATLLKRLGLSYLIPGAWNVHLGRFIIFYSDSIQLRAGLGWPAPLPAIEITVPPLDAEGDSQLPPGATWHRARIAQIPVPGETWDERIIRQRRWIFARQNLPSPDDNPFDGLVFDPAINYHRVEWGDPVPQHVWE